MIPWRDLSARYIPLMHSAADGQGSRFLFVLLRLCLYQYSGVSFCQCRGFQFFWTHSPEALGQMKFHIEVFEELPDCFNRSCALHSHRQCVSFDSLYRTRSPGLIGAGCGLASSCLPFPSSLLLPMHPKGLGQCASVSSLGSSDALPGRSTATLTQQECRPPGRWLPAPLWVTLLPS